METKFQTSFIPKKPIVEEQKTSSGVGLFLLISIIVFLVAVGLLAWVIIEKSILIKKIDADKTTIEKDRSNFEPDTIESMIRLDSRIKVAGELLKNHISVSPVFAFLEDRTLKNIRFKNFHFTSNSKDDSGANSIRVEMLGQARDFKTIALQADELGKVEFRNFINNPVFSDLNLTTDGSVSFTYSMNINPDLVSYNQTFLNNK